MARAKESVWEAKFHRMRRETWWGVVLGLCAAIYAVYSIKQRVLNPGWDLSAHLWGNPYAVGFAWGTAGILIPLGLALLFWSGAAKKLIEDFKGIGLGLVIVFLACIAVGGWVWGYYTRLVISDDVQQEGWMLGLFTVLVLVSGTKTELLGVLGRPMWKVHGRVKSKRFARRSSIPAVTDDEYLDESHSPVPDGDNLALFDPGPPKRSRAQS